MGQQGSAEIKPTARKMGVTKLTDAERIFCAEYLANGLNATEAVKVAFPNVKWVSRMVSNVLSRDRVKRYLGYMLHGRLEKAGLATERILAQLETALFLDPLEIFQPGDMDGVYKVKSLDDVPIEVRKCISEIKTKVTYTDDGDKVVHMELKLIPKEKALELAMKYAGLLKPGAQINVQAKNVAIVDFDKLCSPDADDDKDVIEGLIAGAVQECDDEEE